MNQFFKRAREIVDWRLIILVFIVGIPIGLGIFTFSYARGTAYFSDDPQACMNCHVMRDQFEAWQHSSHSRVATCNDCHTPHTFVEKWVVKGINGFNHSLAFTTGAFHEPIRANAMNASVVQQNCIECHADVTTMMAANHDAEELACVTCHNDVGHDTRN
jgi:cytochrome c nitrite reductase small subunit